MPTGTRRTGPKSPALDGAEDDPSMDFEDVTVETSADEPETPTAAAPDVQQAVLDVLASLGLTGADVAALAKEKRSKASHETVDLNTGTFPERIAAHRVRAAEVKAEDPDLAEKLLLTARGLQAEHKLATTRGEKYQPHADICDDHFPDGWPLGTHHASCEHGEYDR
jgi:hypothetical protein